MFGCQDGPFRNIITITASVWGTTSPAEKLEVSGNIKATGTGNITATGNVLAEGTIGNTVTGINGISNYNLWNVNSTLLTELKSFI